MLSSISAPLGDYPAARTAILLGHNAAKSTLENAVAPVYWKRDKGKLRQHSNHALSTDVVFTALQTNQGAHIRYCAYEWKQYKFI
jgi:hypothetical protein